MVRCCLTFFRDLLKSEVIISFKKNSKKFFESNDFLYEALVIQSIIEERINVILIK